MKSTLSALALILTLAGSQLANAQDAAGGGAPSFGVGASGMLTGSGVGAGFATPAAKIVYDTGVFHIDGLIGLASQDPLTIFRIGGAFWYHVHKTTVSDFSVGGGLGIINVSSDSMAVKDQTQFGVNVGGQLRAFLVPNVALDATGGISFVTADGPDFFGLGGQLFGSFGLTYFFR